MKTISALFYSIVATTAATVQVTFILRQSLQFQVLLLYIDDCTTMTLLPKNSNTSQKKKGNFHPLLEELNIAAKPVEHSSTCDSSEDASSSSSLSSISPSDLLSYLLETNRLTEKTLRVAVQAIHKIEQQSLKDNSDSNNNNQPHAIDKIGNADPSTSIPPTPAPAPIATTNTTTTTTTQITTGERYRHIALRFHYDGALFSGLAQNIGQEKDNSVERELFDALLKTRLVVSRSECGYSRCGRTDRGVSAASQVVAFNIKSAFPVNASWTEDGTSLLEAKDLPRNEDESRKVWNLPRPRKKNSNTTTSTMNRLEKDMKEYPYSRILNSILPPSIRILGWTPVTEEFSARFSSGARTYRYFFCKRQMNMDLIRDGLRNLVGKHDFRNLCKMDVEKVYNFERVIHSAELIQLSTTKTGDGEEKDSNRHQDVYYLQIIGQAFLWHQIRYIAEVIFMVGRGYEPPSIISELLDVKKYPGKPSYCLADEKPLVLHNCSYPNLQFGYSVQNMWKVSCELEKEWEELTLAAARIRNTIDSFSQISVSKEELIAFSTSKLTKHREKLLRKGLKDNSNINHRGDQDQGDSLASSTMIPWEDSLSWLKERNLFPCADGLTSSVHIPLMTRSMGPSYEEKVESLKKSEKRRLRFETNVTKRSKTAEEDQEFYDHKIKQGGSGI
jgi:tRNA pseudouridine38/39 synthase